MLSLAQVSLAVASAALAATQVHLPSVSHSPRHAAAILGAREVRVASEKGFARCDLPILTSNTSVWLETKGMGAEMTILRRQFPLPYVMYFFQGAKPIGELKCPQSTVCTIAAAWHGQAWAPLFFQTPSHAAPRQVPISYGVSKGQLFVTHSFPGPAIGTLMLNEALVAFGKKPETLCLGFYRRCRGVVMHGFTRLTHPRDIVSFHDRAIQ